MPAQKTRTKAILLQKKFPFCFAGMAFLVFCAGIPPERREKNGADGQRTGRIVKRVQRERKSFKRRFFSPPGAC